MRRERRPASLRWSTGGSTAMSDQQPPWAHTAQPRYGRVLCQNSPGPLWYPRWPQYHCPALWVYLKGLRPGFVKASMLRRELFSLTSRKEEKGFDALLGNEGGKGLCVCPGCTAVKAGWEVRMTSGQCLPLQTSKRTEKSNQHRRGHRCRSISLRAWGDFGFYHYREKERWKLPERRAGVPYWFNIESVFASGATSAGEIQRVPRWWGKCLLVNAPGDLPWRRCCLGLCVSSLQQFCVLQLSIFNI